MKKIILILMSALCFVFVGQAFAVGGPQSITAIVSSVSTLPTTGLMVTFKSTAQPVARIYAAKIGVGAPLLVKASPHVTANYKSHKTIIWNLYRFDMSPGHLILGASCIKLGFSPYYDRYYYKAKGDGSSGYWVHYYSAKRTTAYSHYKFSYTVVRDNDGLDILYCNEKAWD